MKIILASASPRRKEILEGLGVEFTVMTADTDESCELDDPQKYASTLAMRKANAVLGELDATEDFALISADTVVAAGGDILGKPKDRDDAVRMLELLSGSEHSVITGICVATKSDMRALAVTTRVRVSEIPHDEIIRYVESGDPMDKAGAYGIQGAFSKWVEGIDGCYFNVVGLPANALNKLFFEVTGKYL